MQVTILSDLHLEFRYGREKAYIDGLPINREIPLILAGDLTTFNNQADQWTPEHAFEYLCTLVPQLIYVPGNHEYYKAVSIPVVTERLHAIEATHENLKILHCNEVFLYKGRRFLGDTMWFPDVAGVWIGRKAINDPALIKDLFPQVFIHNDAFRNWIGAECKKDDIIVTHHLPSGKSQPQWFANTITSPYFVSNMEDIIIEKEPAVWIHGHTHSRQDYVVGNTRVICNSVGYPGEINEALYYNSVFEV